MSRLNYLREAGKHEQAAALASRAAAHPLPDRLRGFARLLDKSAGGGRPRAGRRADRPPADCGYVQALLGYRTPQEVLDEYLDGQEAA